MRKRPSDAPASVDNALRLLHLLRDQGEVTVTEAARSLGVSAAAAHRLLATLVHRDFAVRDERRRYLAGPALWLKPGTGSPVAALRAALLPAMHELAGERGETVSLGVLLGPKLRIVATAETTREPRVGDQEGTVLSTHLSASGKAVLSRLEPADVLALYGEERDLDRARLADELLRVRQHGFAVNHGAAEAGVSAIGVALTDSSGRPRAGLALVMPSDRFSTFEVADHAAALRRTAAATRPDLDRAVA